MRSNGNLSKKKYKSLLKIRAKVLEASRFWLDNHRFTEVQGPILIPAVGARPNSFKVNYFHQSAFLTGGLQPYTDFFLEMLDNIYTISPAFRAAKIKSNRHLAEFWRIEATALDSKFEDILKIEEAMLAHVCSILVKDCSDDIIQLHGSIDELKQVKVPFNRLTYDNAVEKLLSVGSKMVWGEPLDCEMECKLSLMFDQPFFVTHFPINTENFFYKSIYEKAVTLSSDLLAPGGYAELASGGELITEKREFLNASKGLHLDNKDKKWYLNLRRFDSTPRSGFALGIERLLQWICKLENIQEAIAFPRAYKKIYC